MEVCTRNGSHDFNLASRKAEVAAGRRFEAVKWLVSLVGPLGMSDYPSEMEFISCLRNGLVLCNALNKIKPGTVPKVVEIHQPLQSISRESQPLPAYQYFENVRNFLVAVEELKIPAFEASDLERDTLEVASAAKVVDCILGLKSYHDWKLTNGGNGFYKQARSPMVMHSANRANVQTSAAIQSDACRRLDMSAVCENQPCLGGGAKAAKLLEDSIVKALVERLVDSKENIDNDLLTFMRDGKQDPVKIFSKIMSNCLEERLQNKFDDLKLEIGGCLEERKSPSSLQMSGCCRACLCKDNCSHRRLFKMQEKELVDLKDLLSRTKREFEDLQAHLARDLKELGNQVQEMSTAATGYHRVVKENRNLYNMVQDLKGNIRVYCRIRPPLCAETRNVIDFIGEDGSLVILDPLKPQKDGRKLFQFNHVFGPTATQDVVFSDTRPLIRSVMDGYNACIFAYGQTGSGKTHTMSGPSDGSAKDMGIIYLALHDLFEMSNKRKDVVNYDIRVQMVEIYNEQVRDLLGENSSTTKLEIRSCTGDNGLALPDATMHSVRSTADVLNLMKLGEVNRVVSSTAINNRSSRSHSIVTVHVHGEDVSGSTFRSCLHLVDLAGSERVDKSEVTGDRLKEAQYINKSLSCLGDVITALAQKNSHIPYRNSKLTLLLQDSLGGHAKTLMIAHISPEEDSYGETLGTLKFAQRVSTVELGAARANKQSSEVMQLKEQVESLKKALVNKEANVQTPTQYRRLSMENCSTMKSEKTVKQCVYLNTTREPRSPRAVTERTPPRTRRLSIENCSAVKNEKTVKLSVNSHKTREPRSPCAVTERTPPRSRRLSIENCSVVKTEKAVNVENRTPSGPTRARRLSLEGPRYGKKATLHIKVPDNQACAEYEGAKAAPKMRYYWQSNDNSSTMDAYQSKAPPSPTSSTYQKQAIKTDCRAQIPSIQLPKTPEPLIRARNEVQIVMKSEITLSTESHTPILSATTNGKGVSSQLKKSLRTIGKLINGSEKRNRQKQAETLQFNTDLKSPVSTNARTQRRQSLTGIQTTRRSSLGGKQPDFNADDNRLPKTPPSVHPSTKATKRWL